MHDLALQILYALDGGATLDEARVRATRALLANHFTDGEGEYGSEDDLDSAVALVQKLLPATPAIDERLRAQSKSWRLERMAQVDRNLLRLMVYLVDTRALDAKAAVERARTLAAHYSTQESISFVTGLLERTLAA